MINKLYIIRYWKKKTFIGGISLRNISKSKAAANSIYIEPLLQSEIDMQAGSISSEERDDKTSYSYFYEAFKYLNMNQMKYP